MVDVVAGCHHHLDPDQFDIDPRYLEGLQRLFDMPAASASELAVSADDLLVLETIAWAAATCADRGLARPPAGLTADECWTFFDWFGQARRDLATGEPASALSATARRRPPQ
jgi:hypothetical protein